MLPGDALLFYTDGLVETPDRDLSIGIDRLLGMAERLVTGGFTSGARTLMSAVPDTESDDRACVLIWRT
jgi:serine phosphatase RsbU (regulator of sigma subunit)